MNKNQFVEQLSRVTGTSKAESKSWVDSFIKGIQFYINTGNGIRLSGLGSFTRVRRKARKGRNPRTGEQINIPAKWAPKFKPSQKLKELVHKKNKKPSIPKKVSLSIGEKGGLCVSGINKFPVTLYKDQWKKLLQNSSKILSFIDEYEAVLSHEGSRKKSVKDDLKMKKSSKGGFSVYGFGRFPITLKGEQWRVLLSKKRTILKYISENNSKLKSKPRNIKSASDK